MTIDPDAWAWCGLCNCATLMCPVCGLGSCSAGSCPVCHDVFVEAIRLEAEGLAPTKEEIERRRG